MAEVFGQSTLDLWAETPHQVAELLEANAPGQFSSMLASGAFVIFLNDEPLTGELLHKPLAPEDEIHILPVVAGGIFGIDDLIVAIIVAVVISVGVSLLLARQPKKNIAQDSVAFQSAVNTVQEGSMLPIAIGKVRTGSVIISAERDLFQDQYSYGEYSIGGISWIGVPILEYNQRTITNNTLVSRIQHAVSEGEIKGLVNGAQSILFNGTAIQETNGTNNFPNVRYEQVTGTDPNPEIQIGKGGLATELAPSVSTELKDTERVIRTVSLGVSSVRVLISTPSFYRTKKSGSQRAISETVYIERRVTGSGDSWTIAATLNISGIYNEETFFRSVVSGLDPDTQYDIAVRRANPKATDEIRYQDTLIFDNLVEIISARVTHDGTAIVAVQYDNETLGGENPETEFIIEGLIVDVPTNYDPTTRTYTGIWDGTYKRAYSNNPAFCVQYLLNERRFGLGEFLQDAYSPTGLYTLGQFCDVLVDDGKGGTEPRYTLNTVIRDRKKAMITLRDITSVFHGQAVWNGTQVDFVYDNTRTVEHIFTAANVIGGDFEYQGPDLSGQVNSVIVSYLDADERYGERYQADHDHSRIETFGLNQVEVESLSTSAGQAQRVARYMVRSSDLRTVSFRAAEEAGQLLPGTLIAIYDHVFMGRQQGGRLTTGHTTTSLVLDRDFEIESGKTYTIRVTLADGSIEERTITNAVGTHTTITLNSALTSVPMDYSVWGITASDLAPTLWTVQDRKHEGNGVYRIYAQEYKDGLFSEIETGIGIGTEPVTALPSRNYIEAPTNIEIFGQMSVEGSTNADLHIGWLPVENALGYDVQISYDGGPLQTIATGVRGTSTVYRAARFGDYDILVRARTDTAVSKYYSEVFDFSLANTFVRTPTISGLELFEQGLNTEFQNQDAKFTWRHQQAAYIVESALQETDPLGLEQLDPFFKHYIVRIYDGGTSILRRTDYVRDNHYEYTLERNLDDGGTNRAFRIEVQGEDVFGNLSEVASLEVTNPQIAKITNVNLEAGTGVIIINYPPPAGNDWIGTKVYMSDMSGFTPSEANEVADARANTIPISADPGSTQYIRIAGYDSFGEDSLNYSNELSITVPSGDALALLSYFIPQYGDMAGLAPEDFDVLNGTVSLVTNLKYIGGQGLCLDATGFGQKIWFTPDKDNDLNLNLPGGRRWLLTGWFQTVNANPSNTDLEVEVFGDQGFFTRNTGNPQDLTAANVWQRRGFELDLTGNSETQFALAILSEIGTGAADLYMDGFSLFDVTDLPQYTETNLPPVIYVPSLGAGVAVDGKDGQPGLPGASTVHTYDNLNTPTINTPGDYIFSRNPEGAGADGTNIWSEITGGQVESIWIHQNDTDNVNNSAFLDQLAAADHITWLQSVGRWVEFRITAVVKADFIYKFGVELVEFRESDGIANIDLADGNPVELRYSKAAKGTDGNDGADGRTVDLPGLLTNGVSGTIEVVPNTELGETGNAGEYLIKAGEIKLPDGSVRTLASDAQLNTPFEGVNNTVSNDNTNHMHFPVWGVGNANTRFGIDVDVNGQGFFTVVADFSQNPITYLVYNNLATASVAYTPLVTDVVLGSGYKRGTDSGGITSFTPYFTKVTDVNANEGGTVGVDIKDDQGDVITENEILNSTLIRSNSPDGVGYVVIDGIGGPSGNQDIPWIISNVDGGEIARITLRSFLTGTNAVQVQVLSEDAGFTETFSSPNPSGSQVLVDLSYTDPTTGRMEMHSMRYTVVDYGSTGGGGGPKP